MLYLQYTVYTPIFDRFASLCVYCTVYRCISQLYRKTDMIMSVMVTLTYCTVQYFAELGIDILYCTVFCRAGHMPFSVAQKP